MVLIHHRDMLWCHYRLIMIVFDDANFGPKIRREFPQGLSLTEFIKKRFGIGILKICLFLILFYLTIFLIAEVTAIAFLLNLIAKVLQNYLSSECREIWRTISEF